MLQKIKNKLNGDVHLADLLKGSAITFVLKIGGMGLSYILIYLISKQAGAEGVGFYQVMLQILTVLGMVLGLGMNISVLRYVGEFNNEENRPKMHVLYKYFVQTVTPLAIGAAVFLYFGADYIVQWTGKEQEYAEGLKLVGIVLPFFTINQISVEFIRGLKKLQISELVRSVLRPLVMILGIVVFFYDHLTKIDTIYLLVVGLIINSLVSRWAIWKALKKVPKTMVGFERKQFMKTSYPMLVISLSGVLYQAIPILVTGFVLSMEDVGIYSIAFKIAQILTIPILVINTISAPMISSLFWRGEFKLLKKIISKITFVLAHISIFGGGLLIVMKNTFYVVFNVNHYSFYPVLVLLIVSQVFNSYCGSGGVFLNMTGNEKINRRIQLISILIYIILCWVLSILFGLIGVAIAALIIYSFSNILTVVIIKRKFNIEFYLNPFKNDN
jgi:O-antigen/teichoic acid export membrane protein